MKRFQLEASAAVPRKPEEKPYEAFLWFKANLAQIVLRTKYARKIGQMDFHWVAPSEAQEITVSWNGTFDVPTEEDAAALGSALFGLGQVRAATYTFVSEVLEDLRPPETRSSIWMRLGVSLDVSLDEERLLLNPASDEEVQQGRDLLIRILDERRFHVNGEAYVPATVVQDMNAENGTYYPDDDDVIFVL